MAPYFTLKHFCFAIALLSIATSYCKAQSQDSIQIVAKAALCFDNRTVISNCITMLGKMSNGSANATANSTAGFCDGPCYGHAMLMVNCLDGIFSNFQFYSAGMMQGVRSVLQVSCGKNSTGGSNGSEKMVEAANHGAELAMPVDLAAYVPVLLAAIFLL